MKQIYLTGKYSLNNYCLVDDDLYFKLKDFKWWAKPDRSKKLYAHNGKLGFMHRFIMNAKKGEYIDHINGYTLNNTLENLRICTIAENARNRGKQKNNKSGYKGVYLSMSKRQKTPKWRSQIQFDSKLIHIGCFNTKEEAYKAYCLKSKELFGNFSHIKL